MNEPNAAMAVITGHGGATGDHGAEVRLVQAEQADTMEEGSISYHVRLHAANTMMWHGVA